MTVRVIAGTKRGRGLSVPDGRCTRPTASKAKEAVFSILGDLEGFRVLDLYAGSGALGIEALSRGASFAVFVERDPSALACIRKNLENLALGPSARVLALSVRLALTRLESEGPFHLVFADPPWDAIEQCRKVLGELVPLLAPNGRLVFEHPREKPGTPNELSIAGLVRYDMRAWGDTGASFLCRPQRADQGAELTGLMSPDLRPK